jgi:hypothetical protein
LLLELQLPTQVIDARTVLKKWSRVLERCLIAVVVVLHVTTSITIN